MAQRYWALAVLALASCGADDSEDLFGGNGAAGGAAGTGGGSGGNAGASTSGGSAGSGTAGLGNGGAGTSGSAGSGGGTAGSSSAGDTGCVTQEWCQDVDGDHFGDPASKKTACDSPGGNWLPNEPATPCTDCFDQSGDVHPGSSTCLVKGYGPNGSFDADCDGKETECQAKAGQCGGALCNQGEGYLPEGPSTINPYCGSTKFQQCSGTAFCAPSQVDKPNEPMPCH